MRIDAVSIGKNVPHDVNVIIEVPVGGEPIKYEMDKEAGTLVVDRFLYTSMRYPGNYGFIPHTLSDDGDPCDVVVANTRAIIPGAVMSCKIVGVLLMEDEAGGDEKLLAVPSAKLTQRYAKIENYDDLHLAHGRLARPFRRRRPALRGKGDIRRGRAAHAAPFSHRQDRRHPQPRRSTLRRRIVQSRFAGRPPG